MFRIDTSVETDNKLAVSYSWEGWTEWEMSANTGLLFGVTKCSKIMFW